MPYHALSVDVEEWFQVRNLEGAIARESWDTLERRAEASTRILLDLFEQRGATATFFVLGWMAERSPDLIREIDRRGHEVAVHGYGHRPAATMTPEEFGDDLQQALNIISPLVSKPVEGYRAPSFSLSQSRTQHFDILARNGIRYDSSYFAGRRNTPSGEQRSAFIHRMECGIVEVPITSLMIGNIAVPCGGGGFFRLLPYGATRFLFRLRAASGHPVVFYIHPWEIDPAQPRIPLPAARAFKHRVNLSRTYSRLDRLLADFRFRSIKEVLAAHGY